MYDDNKSAAARPEAAALARDRKAMTWICSCALSDKNEARYDSVAQKPTCRPSFIAALHWRESSGDFGTYLHQGDPLGRPPRRWLTNIPDVLQRRCGQRCLASAKRCAAMFHIGRDTTDMAALRAIRSITNGLGYHY